MQHFPRNAWFTDNLQKSKKKLEILLHLNHFYVFSNPYIKGRPVFILIKDTEILTIQVLLNCIFDSIFKLMPYAILLY